MRKASIALGLLGILFFSALWLSTGTLSGFALTDKGARLLPPCNVLVAKDVADGRFREQQKRRAKQNYQVKDQSLQESLYGVLLRPIENFTNWYLARIGLNFALTALAFGLFFASLLKWYGLPASMLSMLLLVTYPGHAFWFGALSPASFTISFAILAFLLLLQIQNSTSFFMIILSSCALGCICLLADLFPIAALSLFCLLIYRKSRGLLLPCFLAFLFPRVVAQIAAEKHFNLKVRDTGIEAYQETMRSMIQPDGWAAIAASPADFFMPLLNFFLGSGFYLLTSFFLVFFILARGKQKVLVLPAEKALFAAVILLLALHQLGNSFGESELFPASENLHYYQFIVPAMLCYLARAFSLFSLEHLVSSGRWRVAVSALGILQFGVFLLPFVSPAGSGKLYSRYLGSTEVGASVKRNLEMIGARPFGVCKNRFQAQNAPGNF